MKAKSLRGALPGKPARTTTLNGNSTDKEHLSKPKTLHVPEKEEIYEPEDETGAFEISGSIGSNAVPTTMSTLERPRQ